MNNKRLLLLITGLITALVINSCKKDNESPIHALFIGGTWQLASVQAFNYTGNTLDTTITLNDSCHLTQFFTFNADNTCTYTNFDCLPQSPPAGQWSLEGDQLHLNCSIVCKDTTAVGSSKPFSTAFIYNLGQYSMILQTGDIQPNFSLTKKRRIVQYGFIRQKL